MSIKEYAPYQSIAGTPQDKFSGLAWLAAPVQLAVSRYRLGSVSPVASLAVFSLDPLSPQLWASTS